MTGLAATTYTTSVTLIPGSIYKFTISARNSIGFSLGSSKKTIMAAAVPNAPTNVVTQSNSSNAWVSWSPTYNGGSPITAYTVQFRWSDGVTFSANADCNGALASVVTAQSCFAKFSTLNAAPYNIPWGSSVFARVQAINAVGAGAWSAAGNGGAIILITPDAP